MAIAALFQDQRIADAVAHEFYEQPFSLNAERLKLNLSTRASARRASPMIGQVIEHHEIQTGVYG